MMNKNRIHLWRLLVLALFACAPYIVAAQEVDPNEVIRVNTDLVVLDAQVIDKKTRKVFGPLRKEDFEILEENVKQQIAYFGQDQLPLSIRAAARHQRQRAPGDRDKSAKARTTRCVT